MESVVSPVGRVPKRVKQSVCCLRCTGPVWGQNTFSDTRVAENELWFEEHKDLRSFHERAVGQLDDTHPVSGGGRA